MNQSNDYQWVLTSQYKRQSYTLSLFMEETTLINEIVFPGEKKKKKKKPERSIQVASEWNNVLEIGRNTR